MPGDVIALTAIGSTLGPERVNVKVAAFVPEFPSVTLTSLNTNRGAVIIRDEARASVRADGCVLDIRDIQKERLLRLIDSIAIGEKVLPLAVLELTLHLNQE